jgi:hypothetical protein
MLPQQRSISPVDIDDSFPFYESHVLDASMRKGYKLHVILSSARAFQAMHAFIRIRWKRFRPR